MEKMYNRYISCERGNKMTYEEKTLSTERIYEGKILNLRKDKVSVIGGNTSYREIVEHSGGATMAAVTADGKMLMVKQFRKPAGKVMLEAPAGKLEPGEDPLEAAKRELKEETGYTAANVRKLCAFYSSVGYSEEVLTLYLCTDLTPGETDFDENEAIDNVEVPLDELYRMAVAGEIDDAKTLIAIFMAKAALEKK